MLGGTANWVFSGGQNYNDQSGSVDIVITPKKVGIDFASTQSALNVAKDGSITFRVVVKDSDIIGLQTIADLFNGALFKLKIGSQTYILQARAAVIDGIINVSFRMSSELKSILAATTTATSAKNAPQIALELSALSNDGNYSLDATVLTRVFNSAK